MVVPTGDHMGTARHPKDTLDTRTAGKVAFQAPRTTAVGGLDLYSIFTAGMTSPNFSAGRPQDSVNRFQS